MIPGWLQKNSYMKKKYRPSKFWLCSLPYYSSYVLLVKCLFKELRLRLRFLLVHHTVQYWNLFSISPRQEVSVKSILGHFWKNWNEWNSNPGARHDGGPPSWWTMHLEVDQKYYLQQKQVDGLVLPVLDSLDNYKMLSERMNVLTIYLPRRNWSSVLTSSQPESAVVLLWS